MSIISAWQWRFNTNEKDITIFNYFLRFGSRTIKGFIMDLIPLFQLDQDLKFTA